MEQVGVGTVEKRHVDRQIERLMRYGGDMDEGRTDKKRKEKRSVCCFNETTRTTSCHSHWGKTTEQWTKSSLATWRSKVTGHALESLKHLTGEMNERTKGILACCLATKMFSLH